MTHAAIIAAAQGLLARFGDEAPPGALVEMAAALVDALAALGPDEAGSLARADVVRIRLAKFVAARLPAERLRDPTVRRQLRADVRLAAERILGQPIAPSRYLDGASGLPERR